MKPQVTGPGFVTTPDILARHLAEYAAISDRHKDWIAPTTLLISLATTFLTTTPRTIECALILAGLTGATVLWVLRTALCARRPRVSILDVIARVETAGQKLELREARVPSLKAVNPTSPTSCEEVA